MIRPQRPEKRRIADSARITGAGAGIPGLIEVASASTGQWFARVPKTMGRAPDVTPSPSLRIALADRLGRCQGLEEHRLALSVYFVEAVVLQGRVAVLVEPVGPQHRMAVLDGEQSLQHRRLAVSLGAQAGDRLKPELHRLIAVDRVRVRVGRPVLGLVGSQ